MYGKSKYTRRYARKGRNVVSKMAKGKVTKVGVLAKAVKRLQSNMRKRKQYINLWQNGATGVTADYFLINLSQFNSFTNIFASQADDKTGNKMIHQSIGLDLRVTLENIVNEPDTTGFTFFLVSLKDTIGSAFVPSTGALTLTPNVHYVINQGMVMLNKQCFTIHKRKRFTLGNYGQALSTSAAQTQFGTDCRWYWKQRVGKTINNPYGNWSDLFSGLDPSKSYYLLAFNDNSGTDLQNPQLRFSIVHSIEQNSI